MSALTTQRLHEMLSYDPETGLFTRLVGRSGPRARIGDIAGANDGSGYIRVTVDGRQYKAHRLAWFYTYGEWPDEIDHIDLNRSNNRIANLRVVDRSQNRCNCRAYRSNKSGYRGVSYYPPTRKWKAQIQVRGKKIGLGYFETPEAAAARYAAASAELHGEYGRAA